MLSHEISELKKKEQYRGSMLDRALDRLLDRILDMILDRDRILDRVLDQKFECCLFVRDS